MLNLHQELAERLLFQNLNQINRERLLSHRPISHRVLLTTHQQQQRPLERQLLPLESIGESNPR